ncbi:Rieske (2Fe-2S) protein [Natronomonas salsuginis]|uniref:Rieske (2Fe-2S) protein n=1 Tax=Natronomonas salsuginis TaxID=2217661 RepID=A0A4U5J717_9EURY|nr:Rieske 2Fe-2S domain-containing protein [Natronomonas salsuginis]TKR24424.1 Rieske (2Fe-2S) protein [Natronomonas salsuginis]
MSSEPVETDDGKTLYPVEPAANLGEGERITVNIKGREITLFNSNDEFHAVLNFCPHQGGPLCEGLLDGTLTMEDWEWTYSCDGEIVSCPWHGWEFDIKTGEHLSKSDYRVPTYDVVVRDGEVYVVE